MNGHLTDGSNRFVHHALRIFNQILVRISANHTRRFVTLEKYSVLSKGRTRKKGLKIPEYDRILQIVLCFICISVPFFINTANFVNLQHQRLTARTFPPSSSRPTHCGQKQSHSDATRIHHLNVNSPDLNCCCAGCLFAYNRIVLHGGLPLKQTLPTFIVYKLTI